MPVSGLRRRGDRRGVAVVSGRFHRGAEAAFTGGVEDPGKDLSRPGDRSYRGTEVIENPEFVIRVRFDL